ncbi:MAG: hypothetical protein JO362_13735 [Streptomycetaceae bacterium]|nr:hypothetical protein [Streptomycetaceae bacterium]
MVRLAWKTASQPLPVRVQTAVALPAQQSFSARPGQQSTEQPLNGSHSREGPIRSSGLRIFLRWSKKSLQLVTVRRGPT